MLSVRRSEDRGKTDLDWLKSRHTFSFGQYFDPAFQGFHVLRVINEDFVAPEGGFQTHPHKDMEILSYVLSGSLEHRDTMGNHATIRAGEVQLMSAGEGVQHSEFNPSERETAHFLQVWIIPEKKGLKPHYQQKAFPVRDRRNAWQLIASREGSDGSLKIHQQIEIRLAVVEPGGVLRRSFPPGISAWVQVTRGALRLQETVELHAGDGVGCLSESHLVLESLGKEAEVLLFEMP